MAEARKSTIFGKALTIAVLGTPFLLYYQLHTPDRAAAAAAVGAEVVTRTEVLACPTADLLARASVSDLARSASLVSNGGSCFTMPPGIRLHIISIDPSAVQFKLANSPAGGPMWAATDALKQ